MKDMGFRGTILTYAKETVFDYNQQEEFGPGMDAADIDGASSTKCPYIASWRQGTLDTVKLLGEGDQLAVKYGLVNNFFDVELADHFCHDL